jgi:uncharacterized membrane protein
MLILLITIITLFLTRKYFPLYTKQINTTLIILSLWLVIGTTLRHFLSDSRQRHYTDVEMAQVWIKDHPELKPKMKIQDDGSVRIKIKGRKYLHLKDGVLSNQHR